MLGKAARSVLLAAVLLVALNSLAAAQPASDTTDAAPQRYWWVTGGVGRGGIGIAQVATGGVPLTDQVFVGGRILYSEEFAFFSPPETMWTAGPLIGLLLNQGRYGQLSLASGIVAGYKQRKRLISESDCGLLQCSETTHETIPEFWAGMPVNAQLVFTPLRYLGIGLETGFTVMLPATKPAFDLSVQLIVRVPR